MTNGPVAALMRAHAAAEEESLYAAMLADPELRDDGRAVSFFGDLHPSWAGNVVKAMGSAKLGYPVVSRTLARREPTKVTPATASRCQDSGATSGSATPNCSLITMMCCM